MSARAEKFFLGLDRWSEVWFDLTDIQSFKNRHANTRKPDCGLVGHPAEADLGQCLALVDCADSAQNDHRKARVRQGLAPSRWTTLDL